MNSPLEKRKVRLRAACADSAARVRAASEAPARPHPRSRGVPGYPVAIAHPKSLFEKIL
jgi:hypothetical protein